VAEHLITPSSICIYLFLAGCYVILLSPGFWKDLGKQGDLGQPYYIEYQPKKNSNNFYRSLMATIKQVHCLLHASRGWLALN
jgi:hypothetical protein